MRKLIFLLIVSSVVLAPLVFLPYWTSYLGLVSADDSLRSNYSAPDVMVALREGLPVLFLLFVALFHPSFWRSYRLLPVIWLTPLLLIALSIALLLGSYSGGSSKVALVTGARFLIFFLLPVAVFVFLTHLDAQRGKTYTKGLFSVVVGVLLVNLVVSVMDTRMGFGGVRDFGLGRGDMIFGPRVIGITINPNTAGTLFGLSGLLMLSGFQPRRLWIAFWAASIFGSVLTGSRTGMLGTTLVGTAALTISRPKLRPLVVAIVLPVSLFLLLNLDFLSGRAEDLAFLRQSGPYDTRVSILVENVQRMNWLELIVGRGLGYASNTAYRVLDEAERASSEFIISDSLVTMTLLEFGILGATMFWAIVSWFFVTFTSPKVGSVFLLYFGFFSLTQNFVESYPSSPLLGILLGCCAAERYWQEQHAPGVGKYVTGHVQQIASRLT